MADITIVFMGFINQRSHHWGAPSCGNGEEENDRPMKSFSVWAKRASKFGSQKEKGSGCKMVNVFSPSS